MFWKPKKEESSKIGKNSRNLSKHKSSNTNAAIENPIDNWQSPKRRQLHQTPIYKIGGGGARAARRIRIESIAAQHDREPDCEEPATSLGSAFGVSPRAV